MDEVGQGLMEISSILKNIALTVAAIIASYVGIKGLGTWRRQLRGNTEYNLAKNILTSMYQLREAISAIRSQFVFHAGKPDLPPEELDALTREEKMYHGFVQAYQKRWEPISEAHTKLRVSLFEAEAVWGHDMVDKIHPLFGVIRELWLAIQEYFDVQNPNFPHEDRSSERVKRIHAKLFEGDPKTDDLKNQLDAAILNAEIELKPHIAQHHN